MVQRGHLFLRGRSRKFGTSKKDRLVPLCPQHLIVVILGRAVLQEQEKVTSLNYRSEILGKAVLRAAAVLGIEPARLTKVLGVSASSISRLSRGAYSLKRTKKSWELAVLVVRRPAPAAVPSTG